MAKAIFTTNSQILNLPSLSGRNHKSSTHLSDKINSQFASQRKVLLNFKYSPKLTEDLYQPPMTRARQRILSEKRRKNLERDQIRELQERRNREADKFTENEKASLLSLKPSRDDLNYLVKQTFIRNSQMIPQISDKKLLRITNTTNQSTPCQYIREISPIGASDETIIGSKSVLNLSPGRKSSSRGRQLQENPKSSPKCRIQAGSVLYQKLTTVGKQKQIKLVANLPRLH